MQKKKNGRRNRKKRAETVKQKQKLIEEKNKKGRLRVKVRADDFQCSSPVLFLCPLDLSYQLTWAREMIFVCPYRFVEIMIL